MDANLICVVDDEASIILAHEGEITVTSELGKGSCFMVKLPLAHEE